MAARSNLRTPYLFCRNWISRNSWKKDIIIVSRDILAGISTQSSTAFEFVFLSVIRAHNDHDSLNSSIVNSIHHAYPTQDFDNHYEFSRLICMLWCSDKLLLSLSRSIAVLCFMFHFQLWHFMLFCLGNLRCEIIKDESLYSVKLMSNFLLKQFLVFH